MQLCLPRAAGRPIPIMYVPIDGTGGPLVKAETESRAGKVEGQPAHTREAKLGCVFTQTTVDEEGRPMRDEDSTTYTAAIETAEQFGRRIYTEPQCQQFRTGGKAARRSRLLREERGANALSRISIARLVCRFGSDRGGRQDGDRPPAQALRNVLDRPRRQCHHRSSLLQAERQVPGLLGGPPGLNLTSMSRTRPALYFSWDWP